MKNNKNKKVKVVAHHPIKKALDGSFPEGLSEQEELVFCEVLDQQPAKFKHWDGTKAVFEVNAVVERNDVIVKPDGRVRIVSFMIPEVVQPPPKQIIEVKRVRVTIEFLSK